MNNNETGEAEAIANSNPFAVAEMNTEKSQRSPTPYIILSSDEDECHNTKAKGDSNIRESDALVARSNDINSDDDVYMWVQPPTVINIDSNDEDELMNCTIHDIKAELEKMKSEALETHSHDSDEVYMWVEEPIVLNLVSDDDENNRQSNDTDGYLSPVSSYLPDYNMDDIKKPPPFEYSEINRDERYQKKRKVSESNQVDYESDWDAELDKNIADQETFKNASHTESNFQCFEKIRRRSPSPSLSEDWDREEYENANNDAHTNSLADAHPTTISSIHTPSPPRFHDGQTFDGYQDSDYGVKRTVSSKIVSNITQKATDDHPDDVDKQEAKKLDKSKSFSFINEMDKLSQFRFDLNFIVPSSSGGEDLSSHTQIDRNSSISISKANKKGGRLGLVEYSVDGEARIFIKKRYARTLLSNESGYKFLNDALTTYHVQIRMEWERLNNVLVVAGTDDNQKRFHADLIDFLRQSSGKVITNSLPRNRGQLMGIIEEQYNVLLDTSGDVNELFEDMKKNDNLKTKKGNKKADRARRNLNMILMGQGGLGLGKTHLAELERHLQLLSEDESERSVSRKLLDKITAHYNYIFSAYRHDNYPELINEYEELKKSNSLPQLNWDRTLFQYTKPTM